MAPASKQKRVAASGSRHVRLPAPEYSKSLLEDGLEDYVKRVGTKDAFDYGVYETVPVAHGVRGAGLLQVEILISTLLAVSKYLMFRHCDLKEIMTNLAFRHPTLYSKGKGNKPLDRWAGDHAERMMCLTNHVRRLRCSEVRLRQASRNVTDMQAQRLQSIVELCIPADAIPPSPAAARLAEANVRAHSCKDKRPAARLEHPMALGTAWPGLPGLPLKRQRSKPISVEDETIQPEDSISNQGRAATTMDYKEKNAEGEKAATAPEEESYVSSIVQPYSTLAQEALAMMTIPGKKEVKKKPAGAEPIIRTAGEDKNLA